MCTGGPEPPVLVSGTHAIASTGRGADEYAAMRSMWLSGKEQKVGGSTSTPKTLSVLPPSSPTAGPTVAMDRKQMAHSVRGGGSGSSAAPHPSSTNSAKAMPLSRAGRPAQALRAGGGIVKGIPPRYVPGRNAAGAVGQSRDCTVTLAFVSKNRFAATSSFPPKEVSDAYKMNMGRYEPDSKRWTFPLEQYDKLAARLESICRTRVLRLLALLVQKVQILTLRRRCRSRASFSASRESQTLSCTSFGSLLRVAAPQPLRLTLTSLPQKVVL